jgi:hypothetical protein
MKRSDYRPGLIVGSKHNALPGSRPHQEGITIGDYWQIDHVYFCKVQIGEHTYDRALNRLIIHK